MEHGFLQVDGRLVHYEHAGCGRPLLLLHGLVGSTTNWRSNIGHLAQRASVFAFDLANMGRSERVQGLDASLEATADRIVTYMDALGLREADVAGHSHGGAIALMLAARHPDRVGKLILFAPANPFCDLGRHLIGFYSTPVGYWFARCIPAMPRFLKSVALGRMYGDPERVTVEALEGYISGLSIPGTIDHVMAIVRGWSTDMQQLRASLASLSKTPTLLIWGDRDRAVGLSSAEHLGRYLKESTLMVLPGAGHIPFEEMPELCNQAISEWLMAKPA